MDDVTVEKPSPEGLLKIRELTGQSEFTYVGDTADDLRAANGAGVRFIGIAAPDLPEREVLLKQFQEMGASAIIDDINSLEEVL
jgi:phosphoglycolate phosphatase-like HAD superfamily hydrolase